MNKQQDNSYVGYVILLLAPIDFNRMSYFGNEMASQAKVSPKYHLSLALKTSVVLVAPLAYIIYVLSPSFITSQSAEGEVWILCAGTNFSAPFQR